MRLVALVCQETGADANQVMLLRHTNHDTRRLLALGASIEEDYTFIQPIGSKYDYSKHRIRFVVAIVDDRVFGVYRVDGVESKRDYHPLASDAFRLFDIERGKNDRPALRFKTERIPSAADSTPVTGWEGKAISTPLRSNGTLFWEIEVDAHDRL